MIATLFNSFGFVGLASIVLWLAAWALVIAYAARWRKVSFSRAVLGLAILAMILARINSTAVGRIQVDLTQPGVTRADDPARTKAVESLKKRAAGIRFTEDSSVDALDLAGAGSGELKAVEGKATAPAGYDYRTQGKQQRDAGKSHGSALAESQPSEAEAKAASQARYLPEAEVIRANRLDEINLNIVRFTLAAALGLLLFDYLRRFNRASPLLLPLPLSGPMLDTVVPKSHTLCLQQSAGNDGAVRGFLQQAVQKGETFIYAGASDPWPQQTRLSRLALMRSGRRLDKIVCDSTTEDARRDFAFEAAWFGRACITANDKQAANLLLAHVRQSLEQQSAGRTATHRTVNLVTELETSPSAADLEALSLLCRASNFRLVVVTKQPPPADTAKLFDEIRSA